MINTVRFDNGRCLVRLSRSFISILLCITGYWIYSFRLCVSVPDFGVGFDRLLWKLQTERRYILKDTHDAGE